MGRKSHKRRQRKPTNRKRRIVGRRRRLAKT